MIDYEYIPESRDRLSLILQETGLKQFELARQIGVSTASLSHIMSTEGRHGKITDKIADALIAAFPELNFDRQWLLTGEPSQYAVQQQAPVNAGDEHENQAETRQLGLFDSFNIDSLAPNQPAVKVEEEPVAPKVNEVKPAHEVKPTVKSEPKPKTSREEMNENKPKTEPPVRTVASQPTETPVAAQKPEPKIVNIAFFYSDGSFKMFTPQGECIRSGNTQSWHDSYSAYGYIFSKLLRH